MREYSTPLNVDVPATGNLTDDVVANAAEAPDAVVFSRRSAQDPRGWHDVTAAEFLAEVRGVAKGLVAAGIEVGDRVGLISKTRYEWTLVDYAIWFAGAVTVPVYETSSADQIEWILGDSGAVAVVAEGPDHTARIAERRSGPARAQPRLVPDRQRDRGPAPPGRRHRRRRAGVSTYDGDAARSRHGDLHLRHDRPTQGVRAHARLLHVRARRRGPRAPRAVRVR